MTLSPLLTERKTRPSVITAERNHSSMRTLTSAGIGHGADAAALAFKVRDHPPTFALLQLIDGERDHFPTPQPTGDQQRQDGAIALAFPGRVGWRMQEIVDLVFQQPVPCPHPTPLDALRSFNRGGDGWVEAAIVGEFAGQLTNSREPKIDGRGGEAAVEQRCPILLDQGCRFEEYTS